MYNNLYQNIPYSPFEINYIARHTFSLYHSFSLNLDICEEYLQQDVLFTKKIVDLEWMARIVLIHPFLVVDFRSDVYTRIHVSKG